MALKSKSKLIQSRPEPPSLEEVKIDLERAATSASTDVAFTYFNSSTDSNDEPNTGAQKKSNRQSKSKDSDEKSDIDACYNKVIQFLEINEQLKQSQESLQDQCNELQELGQSVKEQVKSLRTQMT